MAVTNAQLLAGLEQTAAAVTAVAESVAGIAARVDALEGGAAPAKTAPAKTTRNTRKAPAKTTAKKTSTRKAPAKKKAPTPTAYCKGFESFPASFVQEHAEPGDRATIVVVFENGAQIDIPAIVGPVVEHDTVGPRITIVNAGDERQRTLLTACTIHDA